MTTDVASAYSATGSAWQLGPGRIYDRLAEIVVDRFVPLRVGALVLDLGAGAGAATRAAQRRGARVVALDVSHGILATSSCGGRPCVGDARALPCRDHAFDAVVAAFSLNHLPDPVSALHEVARVLARRGTIVVTAYARDDDHPVKAAAESALRARGWAPDDWYQDLASTSMPLLSTVDRALRIATLAGLRGARARQVRVPFPELDVSALVRWRLGMAHVAPFVATLSADEREAIEADITARLGSAAPTLTRSIVVLDHTSR